LDVAAVASLWWDRSPAIQRSFLQYSEHYSVQQTKAWAIFFIALHDYGKLDIRFQRKAANVWEILQAEAEKVPTLSITDSKSYDHGSAGLYWFTQDREKGKAGANGDLLSQIADLVDESDDGSEAWLTWVRQVTGHHGFVFAVDQPVPDCSLPLFVERSFAEWDKASRQAWLLELERLFLQPAGMSLDDTPPIPSPLLAGFCSVSDWLGSRTDETNFRYKADPVDDLRTYFEEKCIEDAQRVLDLAGITSRAKPFLGVEALLQQNHKPRQLQKHVEDLPVAPGLTLVEAPTGSGKTEMALAYAWRLAAENLADSIVLAMPTQATANAMLQRVEKMATTLFEEKPNLILAHGNARFNENLNRQAIRCRARKRPGPNACSPHAW
jgi:CRISPR-associated endonuclease/helicase Cas3